jgi:hypothetical protein
MFSGADSTHQIRRAATCGIEAIRGGQQCLPRALGFFRRSNPRLGKQLQLSTRC